jgi:hypothetical protein
VIYRKNMEKIEASDKKGRLQLCRWLIGKEVPEAVTHTSGP